MAFVVLAQALSFQKTDPEHPTIPVAPEEIVERGGEVPAYVTTFTVSALANSGLVAYVDRPDPLIFPAHQVPAQVRTPDQPPVLPSDPNGVPLIQADLTPGPVADDEAAPDEQPADPPLPDLPKTADSKETWENYAQLPQIGMTQGAAEAMNKTDLMAEVKQRYAAASTE
jgi:hypothetical protein